MNRPRPTPSTQLLRESLRQQQLRHQQIQELFIALADLSTGSDQLTSLIGSLQALSHQVHLAHDSLFHQLQPSENDQRSSSKLHDEMSDDLQYYYSLMQSSIAAAALCEQRIQTDLSGLTPQVAEQLQRQQVTRLYLRSSQ